MASLKRLVKSILRPPSNALILAYHRVANLRPDPQLLCVSPEHFREHLEVIKQFFDAASLNQVRGALGPAKTPTKRVIVTFDDGYGDNLNEALPLLERYDIPATVFIVTGFMGDGRFFYWDILAHIFLSSHVLPDRLALDVSGVEHRWHVEPQIHQQWDAVQEWTVLSSHDPSPRCAVYKEITQILKTQSSKARTRLLKYLVEWSGLSLEAMREDYHTLSESDFQVVARHRLLDIGSHSSTHPTLAILPTDQQEEEILGSKQVLEAIMGRPVSSFSYPYGTRNDFTSATLQLVKEAGFDVACANFPARLGRGTDPFALPRFLVRDWDGDALHQRLREWFEE
jgi:peptidoglycan/xylan/chitin deacetylase (PgdA/CDA1 family)